MDDETRRIIDAEVLQLRVRISNLLSRRNSLAPISRLPAEVVTIIFVYAQDFSKIKSKSTLAMKISWICRDWRRISLDCSRLWAEIDFAHQRGVREFISRSRQASLSVTLSCDFPLVKTILRSSHRMCALDLSWGSFKSNRSTCLDLEVTWTKETPFLQSLSLYGTTIPSIIVSHPPPLQHLQLQNCLFKWDLPLFPSLTTLSVIDPTDTISLKDLLSKLANLPALTNLTLDTVLSYLPFPSGDTEFAHANLPKLQDLTITDQNIRQLTKLIRHLSVAKGTVFYVTISELRHGTTPLDLLDAIRQSRSFTGPIPFLRLVETAGLTLFEFTEKPPEPDQRPICTLIRFDVFRGPQITSEISNYLELGSLEKLEVLQNPYDQFYMDRWIKEFGQLPKLRHITVYEQSAYCFVKFLRDEAEVVKEMLEWNEQTKEGIENEMKRIKAVKEKARLDPLYKPMPYELKEPKEFTPGPIKLSFKALRSLVLHFPSLKADEDDVDGQDFQHDIVDEANILYNLTTRLNEGAGLTELVYHNWPMEEETLENLEGVVETVVDFEHLS
ncbi:hypothetical protein BDN72DRAFT_845866 [Pluteus cervinus]|uniref:Uncharacterized protein n=1 Tax=Pluteus cervinus TaxID=181527 RepID=A0ACD3AHJ9_9AGAR|nr:hypothetical protein BDN72DRAFT_845866 [Pluteus cervinus]